MILEEQVFAQALVLAGRLEEAQYELLRLLCRSAASGIAARLRRGLTPEDCKADFLAAASLIALAALSEAGSGGDMAQVRVGEITLQPRGKDTASRCLRNQAELIIAPYLQDKFSFLGV